MSSPNERLSIARIGLGWRVYCVSTDFGKKKQGLFNKYCHCVFLKHWMSGNISKSQCQQNFVVELVEKQLCHGTRDNQEHKMIKRWKNVTKVTRYIFCYILIYPCRKCRKWQWWWSPWELVNDLVSLSLYLAFLLAPSQLHMFPHSRLSFKKHFTSSTVISLHLNLTKVILIHIMIWVYTRLCSKSSVASSVAGLLSIKEY